MDDFEIAREKDGAFTSHFKCKSCGERVESGISAVSNHWVHCVKRTKGLIIAKSSLEEQILDRLSINVNQKS